MKTSINLETLHKVINNSTWVNNENNTIFNFIDGKELSINGENHLPYSLSYTDNKVKINMGTKKSYYVDYVNDFTLCLYNNAESFRITPE